MKKKLFMIFGPLVLSVILLAVFFFSPYKIDTKNQTLLKDAASSMSGNVLRGNAIKNQAIGEKKFVPFFGSSELSRVSPFHPSALAEKYDRHYTPFLLGAPGTQSLSQFMMMQSMGKELSHRKAVFVISPQWFVPKGVNPPAFDAYYSEIQTYQWLLGADKVTSSDRYLARRLLSYHKPAKDPHMKEILTRVSEGDGLTQTERQYLQFKSNMLNREDELFSRIGLISRQPAIDKAASELPSTYNMKQLTTLADTLGEKSTTNNSFGISNQFYAKRLEKRIDQFKDSQKEWDYRYSPEFSDFQLVLKQLAKEHTDVLFILPPVNRSWADYTGLSKEMLDGFSKKIKFQLQSQGFNNIADFTDRGAEKYFMADTIHLGWRGWLAADQRIQPFLEDTHPADQNYHIDNAFYSRQWQEHSANGLTLRNK